ncbi:MAG: PAS domain-containing protein [Bacteroidia bacterium]
MELLAKLNLCIWRKNLKTLQYEYLSPATSGIYGLSIENIQSNPDFWLSQVHPDDLPMVLSYATALSENPIEVDIEYRLLFSDGSIKWIRDLKKSLTDENMQVAYIEGISEDITERKAFSLSLQASEDRYRFYFEHNPIPMWVYRPSDLAFIKVNEAACIKYGYTKSEFLTMNIGQIRPESDLGRLRNSIDQLSLGYHNSGVWQHLTKCGKTLFVQICSYTYQKNHERKTLVMAHDVTEAHINAQKLEAYAFITSHQLRKPLANIKGLIELIRHEEACEQIKKLCELLGETSNELDKVIRNTMELIRK